MSFDQRIPNIAWGNANLLDIDLWFDSNILLQLTLLYEEVLYTILHCLGKPEPNHVADPEELSAYVQKVRSKV